jgi:acetate kinase
MSANGPGRTDGSVVTPGRVLVLNAGSATLKATVLDLPSIDARSDRTVEWMAGTSTSAIGQAVDEAMEQLGADGIPPESVAVVGYRVVHGGEGFTAATAIDDTVLGDLDRIGDLAPLHNPTATATIRAARGRLGRATHVAAFDTAFHATLPEVARRYPIPDRWAKDYGVRRFGFHGLSVAWSVRQAARLLARSSSELRLVVAHLGGGCSVTAVDRGRSVHTSMGMTPLEGLMMGTRAGSIDPGIVFRLLRSGLEPDDVEHALDHESGLRGVGGTDDMRALLARESDGDRRAALAIDLFVDRAAAGIASAATALGHLDALVFTGGIGERASDVRSRICARLSILAIPEPPTDDVLADSVVAHRPSGIAVCVIHAREDVVIAEAALEVARR